MYFDRFIYAYSAIDSWFKSGLIEKIKYKAKMVGINIIIE